MAYSRELWRDLAVGTMLGCMVLAALLAEGTPRWLRSVATGVVVLAMLAPLLPVLVLLPWHLIAVRRGLAPRSTTSFTLAIREGDVVITHAIKAACYPLNEVARARVARNSNWTESKMLEDALSLVDTRGRRLARVPLTAHGVEEVVGELKRRGIPIDEVEVSAPAFLD
jgi:hypothetical protein